MRYLSLFSGIEAATVAWHPIGWECVGVAEIEPFPCAVLAHHYPDVPNLGDVTKITEEQIKALGHIDVVVFGSPCQDLSVAGHRKGLINADGTVTRSGLFFTAINIARWSGARFWLWENVPGAFSSNKGRDFAAVVEFMAGLDEVPVPVKGWGTEGVAVGDNGLLEWGVLDAQWFGVAQRRRRVFALLDSGDWSSRPPILLEPESLRGDSAPRREAWETVTPTIRAGAANGGAGHGARRGDSNDELIVPVTCMAHGQANAEIAVERSPTLNCLHEAPIVAHALRGEGFDAGEDGTGRGAPLVSVAFAQNSRDEVRLMGGDGQIVGALAAEPGMKQTCYVAQTVSLRGREGGGTAELGGEVNSALRASSGGGDKPYVLAPVCPLVAFHPTQDPIHSSDGSTHAMGCGSKNGQASVAVAIGWSEELTAGVDVAGTIQRGGDGGRHDGVMTSAMQVRRLVPEECEALQGFPRGYTNIPWRSKPTSPDGPRYKALGNSFAVPVVRWIGRQIEKAVQQ